MSETSITFIYDGKCPFCNHFAELLEMKSKIKDLIILDGRKNKPLLRDLLKKGFDLDKGAILLDGGNIYHGSDAINYVCSRIQNPSDKLLKILSITFKSNRRSKFIFPFLVTARRLALISKGISTSPL